MARCHNPQPHRPVVRFVVLVPALDGEGHVGESRGLANRALGKVFFGLGVTVLDEEGVVPVYVEAHSLESRGDGHIVDDLRALPEEPRVRQAGTVATIAEIEDRIAAIDYQLNDPSLQMTGEEEEIFWRERVRLMKLLVGLRYAQAQRTGY